MIDDERLKAALSGSVNYLSNDEVLAMAREILERRERERWIPISEEMPLVSMEVWVAYTHQGRTYTDIGVWSGEYWYFEDDGRVHFSEYDMEVTHWKNIIYPASPKEGASQ